WEDSVTTSTVALSWPNPPFADIDGDGRKAIVVSVFNAQGREGWEMRVHDAVTGKLKYREPGLIAARLIRTEGEAGAQILAEESDEGSDARPDGGFVVQHPKGSIILKVKDGKLQRTRGPPAAPPRISATQNIASSDGAAPEILAADVLGEGTNQL